MTDAAMTETTMTEATNAPPGNSSAGDEERSWGSLLADPSTIAALLVVVSAVIFFVIAIANRHDHSTHEHPGAEVSAVEASTVGASTADASTSGTVHDHSTHVHSEPSGPTFASTDRINPPAACRTIIGCDDAGPSPQHSGDRGGWAQLATLGVVALGVAFIALRIVRAVRRAATVLG